MERAPASSSTFIAPRSAAAGADRPNLLRSFAIAGAVALHAALVLLASLPVKPFERAPVADGGEQVVVAVPVVPYPIIGCGFGGNRHPLRPGADAREAARQGVLASVSPVPAVSLLPDGLGAVDAGGHAVRPSLPLRALVSPAPAYPPQALRAGLSGWVEIEVVVGADGTPLRASVVCSSGSRALDNAALATVLKRWRFRPQLRDGEAVEAVARVPVEFVLPRAVASG